MNLQSMDHKTGLYEVPDKERIYVSEMGLRPLNISVFLSYGSQIGAAPSSKQRTTPGF